MITLVGKDGFISFRGEVPPGPYFEFVERTDQPRYQMNDNPALQVSYTKRRFYRHTDHVYIEQP